MVEDERLVGSAAASSPPMLADVAVIKAADEQAAILAELGCDVLQGYLFARPMPVRELMRCVRGWVANAPAIAQPQMG